MALKSSKSLADFRSKFDRDVVIPGKIEAALKAMTAEHGPEAWEMEGDFTRRAAVSQTDMGQYRERFADHIVMVKDIGRATKGNPRRAWFADKKVAAKARGA